MSMASVRGSVVSTPLHHASSLSSCNDTPLLRCRDCEGYADPTATHSDCTIRGIRKAGYAAACRPAGKQPNGRKRRKRAGVGFIARVITVTPTRKDMSMDKHPGVLNAWTPEEDAMLREFAHEGNADVALRLGRSASATQQRAAKLGVSLAKTRTVIEAVPKQAPVATIPKGTYHCCSRELVPSCPLRTENNDCTGDFPRDKYPPSVAECKAAAMPIGESIETSAPVPTCDDAAVISEVSTDAPVISSAKLPRYVGVDMKPILAEAERLFPSQRDHAEAVYDTWSNKVVAVVLEPSRTGTGASEVAHALNEAAAAAEVAL